MAISNAYKSGWRSRRRSRLSLVERAVPRLGRLTGPESGAQPTPPSSSDEIASSDQRPDVTARLLDDFSEDLSPNSPIEDGSPARDDLVPSPDDQPAASGGQAPRRMTVPEIRAFPELGPSSPATDEAADSEEVFDRTETSDETEVGFGPDDDHRSDDSDDEILSSKMTSDATEAVAEAADDRAEEAARLLHEESPSADQAVEPFPSPRIAADHDDIDLTESDAAPDAHADGLLDASPPGLAESLGNDWDLDSIAAAISADADPSTIRFDWDTLVASGLVDPRDRARPLPANIDDIARALVRQALSDQSGWRDRIILVSSAREGRAKSMAAINFAFALTTVDRHSVVLLDANMDGGGVGYYLGESDRRPGLTTALCDSTLDVDDIAFETDLERLTLVPSGDYEDDILDRFASRRMLEVLRFLTKDPDTLLVLDAPPILSSQEATVLSVIAGQVVLVVEAGVTDESSINLALKRIGDRHNVSLVLSENAGLANSDDTAIKETPASRRLALPTPKTSASKRRMRRAVAGIAIGIGFGLSLLLSLAAQADIAWPGGEKPLGASDIQLKFMAPQTDGPLQ